MTANRHCPACDETVKPVVRDATGHRCPLCGHGFEARTDDRPNYFAARLLTVLRDRNPSP